MLRMILPAFGAFSMLLLGSIAHAATQTVAQPVVPNVPKIQFPGIERLPAELQKELEKLLDPALPKEAGRELAQGAAIQLKWGGLRLKKVNAPLQEQLGLPDNEGMVVVAVEPNSVADRAGLKMNDVLVKINDRPVPYDPKEFTKLVKDQKPGAAVDLVVVRKGKEEALKGVSMPVVVQVSPGTGRGFPGLIVPRININPGLGRGPNFPLQPGKIDNLHLEMSVGGAKVLRKQTPEQFSGEYVKDDLKIQVHGKIESGVPRIAEIMVQEGKDTKKYARLIEVPVSYRLTIQLMLLPSSNSLMLAPLQALPLLPNFPGFPDIPGFNDDR